MHKFLVTLLGLTYAQTQDQQIAADQAVIGTDGVVVYEGAHKFLSEIKSVVVDQEQPGGNAVSQLIQEQIQHKDSEKFMVEQSMQNQFGNVMLMPGGGGAAMQSNAQSQMDGFNSQMGQQQQMMMKMPDIMGVKGMTFQQQMQMQNQMGLGGGPMSQQMAQEQELLGERQRQQQAQYLRGY